MKNYLIDGNNLIGKDEKLKKLQTKDKSRSRQTLAFRLERFFSSKNVKVYLHLDGFPGLPIKVSGIKIIYSEKQSADEKIKQQIEISKNPANIILVTSDNNLNEFGRVCGCEVISSEKFLNLLEAEKNVDDEEARINKIMNTEDFKKIFGV